MPAARAIFRSPLSLCMLAATITACPPSEPRATAGAAPAAPIPETPPTPAPTAPPVAPAVDPPIAPTVKSPAEVPLTREQIAGLSAQIAKGRRHTREGRYDAAITSFTEALTHVSNDARALSGRGYAHLLAGSLSEATRDLEDALSRTRDSDLKAAVHFNLGLIAEKRGDAEAAGRHFARSNTLRPTKAAAAKLQSGTVCPAEIDDTVKEAVQVAGWRELWDRWHFYGGDPPTDEAAARASMCSRDLPCDGEPPWVVLVKNVDEGTTQRVALVQPERPAGLRVQVLDVELQVTLHCDDEFAGLTWEQRAPLLVGSPAVGRGIYFEEGCDDPDAECYGSTCERGGDDFTRTVVLDPADLRLLLTIDDYSAPDNKPRLEVDALGGRFGGGACDRTFTWARATP